MKIIHNTFCIDTSHIHQINATKLALNFLDPLINIQKVIVDQCLLMEILLEISQFVIVLKSCCPS